MEKQIIDINSLESIRELQNKVTQMNTEWTSDIVNAVRTLETYKETLDFSPADANRILDISGINENQDPEEMFMNIHHSPTTFVLRKKFFNTAISQRRVESTLVKIIAELSNVVTGDIISAVTSLIKNMMLICMTSNQETVYKELCFKFFAKDKSTNEVILLVINVKYTGVQSEHGFLKKVINYAKKRVQLSFFGAVVKTVNFNFIDN